MNENTDKSTVVEHPKETWIQHLIKQAKDAGIMSFAQGLAIEAAVKHYDHGTREPIDGAFIGNIINQLNDVR
jgi:hypothetical protein